MNLTILLRPSDILESLAQAGVKEVLIGTKNHSRFGSFTNEEAIDAAIKAKELGLATVLLADALVSEREFEKFSHELLSLSSHFDAIRALDPGVMQFLFEQTTKPLHFVADT